MCVRVCFSSKKHTALPVGLISSGTLVPFCRHRIKQQPAICDETNTAQALILTHTDSHSRPFALRLFLSFRLSFWLSSPRPSTHLGVFALSLLLPPSAAASTLVVLRECQTMVPDSFPLSPSLSLPPSLSRCVYLLHAFCEECWQTLKMSFRKWV